MIHLQCRTWQSTIKERSKLNDKQYSIQGKPKKETAQRAVDVSDQTVGIHTLSSCSRDGPLQTDAKRIGGRVLLPIPLICSRRSLGVWNTYLLVKR